MAGLIDKLKQTAGFAETPQSNPSLLAQLEESTTLSRQQRLTGFGISLGLAALFWGLAVFVIMFMNITGFAMFFTLGSLSSLASTMFLVGPMKQLRNIFTKQRMAATLTYFFSMILTLYAALGLRNFLLVIPCMIIQFVALIWYCSTWIPGGQGVFLHMVGASSLASNV